jgi:hypothetical protein
MTDENKPSIDEILQETLIKNLTNPKQIQSEAGMIVNHSISELIVADKYLRQKEAARKGGNMFGLIKVINE